MGIPSYFAHIVRKHRHIIKTLNAVNPNINNLYLDCNSFIYEAFHSLQNGNNKTAEMFELAIIAYTCDSLIKYIQLLKPNKRLYIAFDGVAPMAKLNQQRNRRYMTAYQSKLDNDHKWNTSAITPGTEFMSKLGTLIKARFCQANAKEFGLETIIVSTSEECGEGEHKIYDYIRKNAEYHKDTKTVIYGLDADLIMLTLNHLHISENMYLFRETPEFIKNLDKTLNPNELYLMDIPLFARTIIHELTANADVQNIDDVSLQNDALFDYIFMCFFLGNDFLPHFPALNIRTKGIDRLIQAYKVVFADKNKETLTKDRTIVWKNVRLFIDYLAKHELTYIKEEYVQRDKLSKRTLMDESFKEKKREEFDDTLLLPVKERSVEIYINPNESGWETRYYKSLFNKRINDELRCAISTNYLEGLEWTMKYYSSGCADWRWSYHYYYPPLLVDLIKYVPFTDKHCFVPAKPEQPVSPLVQLSYVLPPTSMDLLPLALKVKLLKEKPDWYIGNYNFLWSFCKFFWEAHVELPHIDITELEEIVK